MKRLTEKDLKPCPVCDTDAKGNKTVCLFGNIFDVVCSGCLMRGPQASSMSQAIKLWNSIRIDNE